MQKHTQIVVLCDPEIYWRWPVRYRKCGVLHFSHMLHLLFTCRITQPQINQFRWFSVGVEMVRKVTWYQQRVWLSESCQHVDRWCRCGWLTLRSLLWSSLHWYTTMNTPEPLTPSTSTQGLSLLNSLASLSLWLCGPVVEWSRHWIATREVASSIPSCSTAR